MLRYLVVVGGLLLLILTVCPVWAIEAVEATMTTAIIDREPVDHVEAFPLQNGKPYCFTRIVGAEGQTVVKHLWYRGTQLMSLVELPVNSPDWRTWSAILFQEDWAGEWHVEVQDAEERIMQTVYFQLR